jgi:hypothetical protein
MTNEITSYLNADAIKEIGQISRNWSLLEFVLPYAASHQPWPMQLTGRCANVFARINTDLSKLSQESSFYDVGDLIGGVSSIPLVVDDIRCNLGYRSYFK